MADYKETLNLPKTDFPMAANLTTREPEMRRKWEESGLYHEIRRARKGAPKYILHDGPPYANGDVHAGTGLNKVLKDIVVRFKTMRGFEAPFVPGWDCHGLPIEHRVVKELGPKAATMAKSEIRKPCLEYASRYVETQRRQFKALGVLGDWEKPYLTYDPRYEVAIIEVFEELWKRGHVTKKHKPIHWCMRCETALAEAELEYKNLPSPSIYAKFRIDANELRGKNIFANEPGIKLNETVNLLIWTTTPWTLPANVAVALHPALEYALIDADGEQAILCKSTIERVKAAGGWTNVNILATVQGRDLLNVKYLQPLWKTPCRVVNANYVRIEDGSGCVHTAPGHGEEDYVTGLEYNLPVVSPVDERGLFTAEARQYAGINVFDANQRICDDLRKDGALLNQSEITHDYPCCWRCKEPVIFRATEQWFILIDHNDGRKKAIEAARKTQWVPAWGENRIEGMLTDRPDWCISRQRSWGVPITAFYCAKCDEVLLNETTFAAVKKLFAERGANAWFDTPAEKILPKGTACAKCGHGNFQKEEDIFDVWFESASSHRAVSMKHPELAFPADLYLEGTDQHRGWFQVSLLASLLSNGERPFKAVVTHGFLVDARTGDKMSKSGFLVPAEEAVTKLGADLFRLWISSIDFTDDIPMSWEILKERAEPYKKIRNTFRFLLGNTSDFNPASDAVADDRLMPLDRWALMKLSNLIKEVTEHYEKFEFFRVYHKLYNYCVVDLSAIYLAMLKDRLYTLGKNSVERRSAQTVLAEILNALTKLYAPILAHTADEIWGHIPGDKKGAWSVVLADWPKEADRKIDPAISGEWETLFKIRDEVLREMEKLRAAKTIGSSLEASVTLHANEKSLADLLAKYRDALPEFLIVSEVVVAEGKTADAVEGRDISGIFLKVGKSSHPKCARCWNLRRSVGSDANRPDLCDRCVSALK